VPASPPPLVPLSNFCKKHEISAENFGTCVGAAAKPRPPLELGEVTSQRESTSPCAHKAGYMNASPLHICRVRLLLLRWCRGAAVWRTVMSCNEHVEKTNILRSHLPSSLCAAPTAREAGVAKPLASLARDTRARATAFPASRAKLTNVVSYAPPSPPSTASPRPFLPRAPRLLLLCARLRTCRRASAVTRWAPSFGRWCATSTASAAAASNAATTTRSSAGSTYFTTRPRAANTCPARSSSTSSPA